MENQLIAPIEPEPAEPAAGSSEAEANVQRFLDRRAAEDDRAKANVASFVNRMKFKEEMGIKGPIDSPDDVAAEYMYGAQERSQRATIENFMKRMQNRSQGGSVAPSAQPAQEAAVDNAPSFLSRAGSVASNVLSGTLNGAKEMPGAAVAGAYDAIHNTVSGAMHAWDSLASWLDDNVANLKVDGYASPAQSVLNTMPAKVSEGQQETMLGHGTREMARFLMGFIPASKAMRAAGMGQTGAAVAGGGISDFITRDPSDKNLSNLIQQFPALQNPVNDFLATKPESPEALNRLRQGLEGLGMGALTEGAIRAVRAVGASRNAKSELDLHQQQFGTLTPEQMSAFDPGAPLVMKPAGKLADSLKATELGVPDDVAARGVAGSAADMPTAGMSKVNLAQYAGEGSGEVYVNLPRINTSEDIRTVITDMAASFKGRIDEARRGVVTNEETVKLADQLGLTPERLLARLPGQAGNAEEITAARALLNTSAEKLLELSQKAAGQGASPLDLYAFRKMVAVHEAIQKEVFGLRAEAGRALQAWSIPIGTGNTEMARGIAQLMDGMGGAPVTQELAKRFAQLAATGAPPGALATAVRRGALATTMDMVKESYVLGLLWNPATHAANSASNLSVAFQQVYERAVAAKIGDFLGSAIDSRVVDGESIAQAYGMMESLHDAMRLAAKAFRTGEGSQSIAKIDLVRQPAISSTAVSRELGHSLTEAQAFAETAVGRGLDLFGTVTRIPGRLLATEDEFFKTIAYRDEVHAQSLRQASQEGWTGPAKWQRMAELANDPPEHIRLSAADAALYATFQNKTGKIGDWLAGSREIGGSLNPAFAILPFVRTPVNILRYTFERTPLAPVVRQWRDEIAAGGARRDLALARMSTGTIVLASALDLASSGLVTGHGPDDPGQRETLQRQGWQPYSFYIGGKYYSYSRFDPAGMLFGVAATVAEKMKASALSGDNMESFDELLAAAATAAAQTATDKTWLRNISEIVTGIKDSEKGSTQAALRAIARMSAPLVPFSSALGVAERIDDPTVRNGNTWEYVQSRLPVLSRSLPPARDLWGQERSPQAIYGRVFDAISPMQVSQDVVSPIDAEIERLGMSPDRIKRSGKFEGADVNFADHPEVYDYYVRLAGNELKHPAWGMGAKDYLDAVVSGKHPMSAAYNLLGDAGKPAFIKNALSEYRDLARRQILAEAPKRFPEFANHVEAGWQDNYMSKLPSALQTMQPPRMLPLMLPPMQAPLPPRPNGPDTFQVPSR